jgi:hypothetical protein
MAKTLAQSWARRCRLSLEMLLRATGQGARFF